MKRRSLTVLLCLLAIISLASVGFASWVISAGDTEEATGNIQVETVSDQRLVIVLDEATKDQSFNLLAPSTQGIKGAWLTAPDATGENKPAEKLSVTIKFAVKYSSTNTAGTPNADVSVAWNDATAKKLAEAVEKGYIAAVPTTAENGGIVMTHDEKGNYEITISFKWGSLFGGNNPYTYYNDGKSANGKIYVETNTDADGKVTRTIHTTEKTGTNITPSTWADEAMLQLDALYKFFTVAGESEGTKDPFTFGIEITATPAAQANN